MLRQRFIMSLGVILIGLFLFQTVTTYIYTHYIMPDPFKKPSIAETEANGEISFKKVTHLLTQKARCLLNRSIHDLVQKSSGNPLKRMPLTLPFLIYNMSF